MKISGTVLAREAGTTRTYTHPESGFSFDTVVDGAVEARVLDTFSASSAVDGLENSRLHLYLSAENAFFRNNSALQDEDLAKKQLSELATATLGKGWAATEIGDPDASNSTNRTLVEFRGEGGAHQAVDIDHYPQGSVMVLNSSAMMDGWSVNHSVEANLKGAKPDLSGMFESAYFIKQ